MWVLESGFRLSIGTLFLVVSLGKAGSEGIIEDEDIEKDDEGEQQEVFGCDGTAAGITSTLLAITKAEAKLASRFSIFSSTTEWHGEKLSCFLTKAAASPQARSVRAGKCNQFDERGDGGDKGVEGGDGIGPGDVSSIKASYSTLFKSADFLKHTDMSMALPGSIETSLTIF